MGNAMPSNQSNQQQSFKQSNTKINVNSFRNNSQNINFKANFSYIKPLGYEIQQIPQQIEFFKAQQTNKKTIECSQNIHYSNRSLNNLTQQFQSYGSETFENLSYIQQITVNWNSFIKMKQKNYQQDYQVIKKIGKGGFGTVNKVKNKYTQVIRAAKIIKKDRLKQTQHKKLLEQLNIMRQLDHPNIIKLYQVYDFNNQYVLILELSQGGQLYKRIKTKKLTEDYIKIFMLQIIKTLIYLHSKGIIHRDLKPQNMLFEDNESCNLKMIDFGLATKFQPLTQQNQPNFINDRVGTPSYIAPQVIYKKYNEKCDVWSAGVILYFMCTGVMPFRGKNQTQLINSILRSELCFKNSYWNKFSQQCKDLIILILQKKPQSRPSAQQILKHKWFQIKLQQIKQTKSSQKTSYTSGQQASQTSKLNLMKASQSSVIYQIGLPSYLNYQKSILDDPIITGILKNISKFSFINPLHAVVNTYIASQLLSKQQRNLLTKLFNQVDIDHNGIITEQELMKVLERQKPISLERVKVLKRKIDTNHNNQIEFTEFVVSALHHQDFMKKQYFQKAFAYFDIDHSGKISYQQIVTFLGDNKNQIQITRMFKQIDQNKDGQIDLDEFIRLFINDTAQLMKFFPQQDNIYETNSEQIQNQSNLLYYNHFNSDIYQRSQMKESNSSNLQKHRIGIGNQLIMLNQNIKFSINKYDLVLQNQKPSRNLIKSQLQDRRKTVLCSLDRSTHKQKENNIIMLNSKEKEKAKRRQSQNISSFNKSINDQNIFL